MSRVTRKEWYRRVNAEWPEQVPPLTSEEAVRAGRKLYRFALKRTFKGPVRVTSGNRYAWVRRGEMIVNPEHGWKGLVHLLSHYCEQGPHGSDHARMELRMIREVKRRGWLTGNLKRPETPPVIRDARKERYERVLARLVSWEAKLLRAERAIAKLLRQKRYYERSVA